MNATLEIPVTHTPITTTYLNTLFFGALKKAGFENGNPCIVKFNAIGDVPEISISEAKGLSAQFNLAFDIQCKKHKDDIDYSQLFTINTDRVNFVGKVIISPGLVVKLDITTLKFNLKDVTDSEIGPIDVKILNAIFDLFDGVLKGMINLIFSRGISMQWLLNWLHITFINLDDSTLRPYDGYFVFMSNPTFNITSALTTAINELRSHFVQSAFVNDELVITQEDIDAFSKIPINKEGKTIKDTLNEAVEQVNYQKEKEYMGETFNPKLVPDDFGLEQPFSRGGNQMLYVA